MVTVASMPTSLAPTEETSKRRYFFACLSARWHHMALAREITWVRTHVHHTYGAPWAGFSTGWASLKAGSVFVQMCHIQGCLNLFSLIWSVIHSWNEIWSINIISQQNAMTMNELYAYSELWRRDIFFKSIAGKLQVWWKFFSFVNLAKFKFNEEILVR